VIAREITPDLAARSPEALRAIGQTVACPKDAWVFHRGDAARAVFLVLDGQVRLSRFARDGSEIALHRAGRGDFFAEAAFNAKRYQCNAIASCPSRLKAAAAPARRRLRQGNSGGKPVNSCKGWAAAAAGRTRTS
jgi:CRP-like cAMP-binding protein